MKITIPETRFTRCREIGISHWWGVQFEFRYAVMSFGFAAMRAARNPYVNSSSTAEYHRLLTVDLPRLSVLHVRPEQTEWARS